MAPASRGISPGLVGPTQNVDEGGTLGLRSLERSRSPGIRFVEKPVVISDYSDFDDFEDSEEGPDLGLKEEPRALLNHLRARCDRVARSRLRSMPSLPLRMKLMLHAELPSAKSSNLRDQLSKWMDKWSEQARQLKEKFELSVNVKEQRRNSNSTRFFWKSWRR